MDVTLTSYLIIGFGLHMKSSKYLFRCIYATRLMQLSYYIAEGKEPYGKCDITGAGHFFKFNSSVLLRAWVWISDAFFHPLPTPTPTLTKFLKFRVNEQVVTWGPHATSHNRHARLCWCLAFETRRRISIIQSENINNVTHLNFVSLMNFVNMIPVRFNVLCVDAC